MISDRLLQIEHVEGRGNGGGLAYEGTVNGIDVYGCNMPKERSVLLSAKMLRSVIHHGLADNHFARTEYRESADLHKGEIVIEFDQDAEWSQTPIFEFALSALLPDVVEADGETAEGSIAAGNEVHSSSERAPQTPPLAENASAPQGVLAPDTAGADPEAFAEPGGQPHV